MTLQLSGRVGPYRLVGRLSEGETRPTLEDVIASLEDETRGVAAAA